MLVRYVSSAQTDLHDCCFNIIHYVTRISYDFKNCLPMWTIGPVFLSYRSRLL